MMEWLSEHRQMLIWAGGTMLLAIAVVAAMACVVLVRLPADHFRPSGQARVLREEMRHPGRKVFKSIVGWVVLAAGVVMLFLPAPGLLVILIGVMLADFPGRKRVQAWLIGRRAVRKTINMLRALFGKPSLKAPLKPDPAAPAVAEGAEPSPADDGPSSPLRHA